jgi:hypothetical protein
VTSEEEQLIKGQSAGSFVLRPHPGTLPQCNQMILNTLGGDAPVSRNVLRPPCSSPRFSSQLGLFQKKLARVICAAGGQTAQTRYLPLALLQGTAYMLIAPRQFLRMVFVTLSLAGCASGPPLYDADAAGRALAQTLRSDDPATMRARFGAYADAAGKFYIGADTDGSARAAYFRWLIPGVLMDWYERGRVSDWKGKIQYNPNTKGLDVYNAKASPTLVNQWTVETDGTVVSPPQFLGLASANRTTYSQHDGLVTIGSGGDKRQFRVVSRDEYVAWIEVAARRDAQKKQDDKEASSAFWNNVAVGVQTLSGEMAQARAQQQADDQARAERQQALMRQHAAQERQRLANNQAEASLRQQQQSQAQAAQLQARAQAQAAAGNRQEAARTAAAQREAEAKAQAAGRTAAAQRQVAEQERVAQVKAGQMAAVQALSSSSTGGAMRQPGTQGLVASPVAPSGGAQPVGPASTEQDPRTCVSQPMVQIKNAACTDATVASITNSCEQAVEARLCLKTVAGKWDCYMSTTMIRAGASWSANTCKGTGQVFLDVRSLGSKRKFHNPS